MRAKFCWSAILIGLLLYGVTPAVTLIAKAPQNALHPDPQGFLVDYTHSPGWFPTIFRPYRQREIPPRMIENSTRLHDLIHDGKLELSLSDALALVLENNLDISVQRYILPIAETDVLRTRGGQASTRFLRALVPAGLSAGALGAGVGSHWLDRNRKRRRNHRRRRRGSNCPGGNL